MKKLILVGSGPFTMEYVSSIAETQLSRLTREEQNDFKSIQDILYSSVINAKDAIFDQLGTLLLKADAYNPISSAFEKSNTCACYDVFTTVWSEATTLRLYGKLLGSGHTISCPVLAIHGEYDPHPAAGVEKPLSTILDEFHFILLTRCSHQPWIERHAKEKI